MKYKRCCTRWLFIMGILLMALAVSSNAFASPLYGGYNGESETWIEVSIFEENRIGFSLKISVGADVDLNWWARFYVSGLFLLPYNLSRIGFSYDVGDVVSASFNSVLPWPLQVGADSNKLIWAATSFLVGVVGVDNNNTTWQETGVPGLWARGVDSHDNQWRWGKILPVLVGFKEDFVSEQGGSLNQEDFTKFEEELRSSKNNFVEEYGLKISSLLMEKLTDDEIMANVRNLSEELNDRMTFLYLTNLLSDDKSRVSLTLDPLSGTTSELNTLLGYVEEKILTDEIRGEMGILLDEFAQDIQPQLKAVKKMVTAP